MSWLLTAMCIVIIPAAAILLSHLAVIRNFADTAEFIDAVDCLFALNKLEYNEDLEVLHYVG